MIGEEACRAAGLCAVGNLNRDVAVSGIRGAAPLLEDGEPAAEEIRETVGGGGAHSAASSGQPYEARGAERPTGLRMPSGSVGGDARD